MKEKLEDLNDALHAQSKTHQKYILLAVGLVAGFILGALFV